MTLADQKSPPGAGSDHEALVDPTLDPPEVDLDRLQDPDWVPRAGSLVPKGVAKPSPGNGRPGVGEPRSMLKDPANRARIAAGVAEFERSGGNCSAAARAAGVSREQMRTAIEHLYGESTSTVREKLVAKIEDGVLADALNIHNLASQRIIERIESNKMNNKELILAMKVAQDAIATKRRWRWDASGGDQTQLGSVSKLLATAMKGGGRVSVEFDEKSATHREVDVTPKSPESAS